MTQTALILGVTGGFGGSLAQALAKRGVALRALHRNPSQAVVDLGNVAKLGNVEWRRGDVMNPEDAIAAAEGVDPLGYYIGPWGYAQMEVLAQAIVGTKSLNDDKLADYIRANTFKTVVGDVKFGKDGEWAQSRVLQVQFQNVKGNDVAQFRDISTQVVLTPSEYASGKVIYPYEKAK